MIQLKLLLALSNFLFWLNWSYKGRCFLVDDHLNLDSAQGHKARTIASVKDKFRDFYSLSISCRCNCFSSSKTYFGIFCENSKFKSIPSFRETVSECSTFKKTATFPIKASKNRQELKKHRKICLLCDKTIAKKTQQNISVCSS